MIGIVRHSPVPCDPAASGAKRIPTTAPAGRRGRTSSPDGPQRPRLEIHGPAFANGGRRCLLRVHEIRQRRPPVVGEHLDRGPGPRRRESILPRVRSTQISHCSLLSSANAPTRQPAFAPHAYRPAWFRGKGFAGRSSGRATDASASSLRRASPHPTDGHPPRGIGDAEFSNARGRNPPTATFPADSRSRTASRRTGPRKYSSPLPPATFVNVRAFPLLARAPGRTEIA